MLQAAFKQESLKFGKEYISTDDVMNKHLMTHACLRKTSKFHHQASFWSWKVCKSCINEFPRQNSWKEYSRPNSANAKSFAYKRGLEWRNHA